MKLIKHNFISNGVTCFSGLFCVFDLYDTQLPRVFVSFYH